MHNDFWMIRQTCVAVAIAFFLAVSMVPASADNLETGVTAYERGQYTTALRRLTPLAEKGDVTAQTVLGLIYMDGKGTKQSYSQALKWFRRAAEQGHAGAQFHLGLMYAGGLGVNRDYAESVHWYRKAAEQGNADAQVNLGLLAPS